MSNAVKIPPEEIYDILKRRLMTTNALWGKKDPDDIEQERVLFFKYYFDISSAIEACLRGILFVYENADKYGKTIKAFGKPHDLSVAFLLRPDDFTAVTNEQEIMENANLDDYNNYLRMISMFNNRDERPFDYLVLNELYTKVRNTRNKLAHGIKAMDENVDFSSSLLADFMYVFYLTHNYYKQVDSADIDNDETA